LNADDSLDTNAVIQNTAETMADYERDFDGHTRFQFKQWMGRDGTQEQAHPALHQNRLAVKREEHCHSK
jgi:hypothetical protein